MASPTMTASAWQYPNAGRVLVGLRLEDLPPRSVELLKIFTLECLGHMVLAQAQPVSQLLVDYARQLGAVQQATIIGPA